MKGEIIIVGAGLSGALAAGLLGRAGWSVHVFEKRQDPRAAAGGRTDGLADDRSPVGRRSIGLGISERARALLVEAGLGEAFSRISVPMTGRVVHGPHGTTSFQPYGARRPGRRADAILMPEGPVYSVRREDLAAALVVLADRLPGVSFHFRRTVTEVDPHRASVDIIGSAGEGLVAGEDGVGKSAVSAEAVIGADGVFSRVRRSFRSVAGIEEEQTEPALEYKQFTIPAESSRLRHDAHHVWPRQGTVLTALPCHDGSFTTALFVPRAGRSFDSFGSEEAFVSFFEAEFPDVAPLVPDLGREYADGPASTLVTLGCRRWHTGRAVLVGDACHAFVPFSGQGANAALEDAAALASSIEDRAPDWEKAFERYAERRKPDTDAIAVLSQVMTPLVLWLAGPLMTGPEAASP